MRSMQDGSKNKLFGFVELEQWESNYPLSDLFHNVPEEKMVSPVDGFGLSVKGQWPITPGLPGWRERMKTPNNEEHHYGKNTQASIPFFERNEKLH